MLKRKKSGFSSQELLVIDELKKGATYQEIAKKLSLSVKTIEYHVKNLKEKTGIADKSDLASFFASQGETIQAPQGRFRKFINANGFVILLTFNICLVSAVCFYFYKVSQREESVVMNIEGIGRDFLMRERIVKRIEEILRSEDGINTVVIVGTGGAGKTTIARSIVANSKAKMKFEVNAETEDSIFSSFLDLAYNIANTPEQKKELELIKNLQDIVDKKNNLIRFVADVLKKSGDWILLMDNVVSLKNIKMYIPGNVEYWGKGRVIMTTRNENIKGSKFIKLSQVIDIEELSDEEKRELFSKILYETRFGNLNEDSQKKIVEFLRSIPSLPLDVCAAAYYLKTTKISMEEYQKSMKESIEKLTEVEKSFLEESANYSETRYGIVSSVLNEILKTKFEFKPLLLEISVLNSQEIPKIFLNMVSDSITVNELIYKLKQQSLISDSENTVSIHRSVQSICYDYLLKELTNEEKQSMLGSITSALMTHDTHGICGSVKMLPHIDALLEKLSDTRLRNAELERRKIDLLLLKGNILFYEAHGIVESLACFKESLELGERVNCFSDEEVALLHLRIGEICTLIGSNIEAEIYLNNSLKLLRKNSMAKAKNYRLLGVIQMRKKSFEDANEFFLHALDVLKNVKGNRTDLLIVESNIYSDMAFNYFMDGINRENARKAVPLMKKAIDVLRKVDKKDERRVVGRLAIHKIKLAGIYNALGNYDTALKMADETDQLINNSGLDNSSIFYVRGIIARERGLSNLRLNNVAVAYEYFMNAREIFTKLMTRDYLFKIKMHEAECLVRLNRLDEAFEACERMFSEDHGRRERNNYSDLFFNTCYYHAAIIKYRQRNLEAAREYFRKFARSMRMFCRCILQNDAYTKLAQENVFGDQVKMNDFFKNSLKIFEAIYWKDYEFTKYYVEKNLLLVKSQ